MENKRILVIGGSGYIGTEVVQVLLNYNYNVTVLSRNPNIGNVKILRGSVLDKDFLLNTVKGFDLIIYLTAVIRSINKSKYKEIVTGLKNLIESMKKNNLKRLIYFSTQNVLIKKTGEYGDSKKECEKVLINSDLNYVIIRPNYVYGIDKKNFFYNLSNIIKKFRICFIIGNGENKIQPINKNDLAKITLDCVKNFKNGLILNASGKDIISINEIIKIISEETSIKFFRFHIPLLFLKFFKIVYKSFEDSP